MKQPKSFKLKRRPVFALFRAVIMRTFYHKPRVTQLEEIQQPCIFVSNHDAKRGPVIAELYLPVRTAPDARLAKTINESVEVLKSGMSVFIFPEDSDDGYKEVMEKFFPGFVMLADAYCRKTGKDVPVYPVYYHAKSKKMVIGAPRFPRALKEQGLDRNAVADVLRDDVNALFNNYISRN